MLQLKQWELGILRDCLKLRIPGLTDISGNAKKDLDLLCKRLITKRVNSGTQVNVEVGGDVVQW